VFKTGTRVNGDPALVELKTRFDAVVLAAGEGSSAFELRIDGIFRADPSSGSRPMAVRAIASGRGAACSADQFLKGLKVTGRPGIFNSRIGKLLEGEMETFLEGADPGARNEPEGGPGSGYSRTEAVRESRRCLDCDCLKRDVCRLRDYAVEYRASPGRYGGERRPVEMKGRESGVVYEPGKCIRCGLCVRITERACEPLGLTFIGRGFDVKVGVPFDGSLAEALGRTAAQCVEACPTGALAFARRKS
jgi:ferredoxin